MKKLLLTSSVALLAIPLPAAPLQSAKVTKVVNDVRLFKPTAAARKARLGDLVSGKTSLQTGRRSRSELRFQDDTITRIGSNSIFSFEKGTRDLRLEQGTILLSVPKNAGGARIRTATVTAAVTGTSIMMEYFRNKWVKIIVLEGSLVTWLEREGPQRRQTIKAGQMMMLKANDRRMPNPVEIDLKRLMQTSGLANQQTFGPLPASATDRISEAVTKQDGLKSEGFLVPINKGSGGPSGGGPSSGGTGGSTPSERSNDNRDIVNDSVIPDSLPRDPGGPPPGGNRPGEGDDP
jgi:hypothetical protein